MDQSTSPDQQQAASAIANHAHLRQKRARSQLSCTPCRQGKLKCNRERDPACDQCIKRGRESACIYVPPPAKNKPSQNVKGRIRQLETLVVDLMNKQNKQAADDNSREDQGVSSRRASRNASGETVQHPSQGEARRSGPAGQPTPPSDSDVSPGWGDEPSTSQHDDSQEAGTDHVSKPFGQMKISRNEISYVGEAHWQAILDGISDLKRDFADETGEDETEETWDADPSTEPPEQTMNGWGSIPMGPSQPYPSAGLGFMLGKGTVVTKEKLLEGIPEKKVADRLLSLWFNSPDPFKPIIHAPTFQDEYRRFWRNQQSAPVMWLGILYAILSFAESFGLRDSDLSSDASKACLERVNKYHEYAASAAVLADFTKPKQYTLECLILYSAGLRSNNAFVNVWLMIGLVVRLGLRMGYHRDPSHYPNISVFHGEMRRRVWCIINMIDTLISFQLGLPSMVREINSDSQPPRNLLDRDFRVDTKILPPNRDVNELTPASYVRAKSRIVRVFAQAAELSHLTITPPTEEVQRLDRELEEAKASIPPLLRMPDISEDITDPAEQLMCRFNLDLLYLKTKTVLHRRYMLTPLTQLSPEEQARGIGVSRKTCIECALRVLQHHHTIYQASQPGGQLESVKWYMGSLSTHDFLLAAMIVCLELNQQISREENIPSRKICPRRKPMMEVLEQSQKIWEETSMKNRQLMALANGTEASSVMCAASRTKMQDGHGLQCAGSHMFSETDKASRAMAAMIAKVRRTTFPPNPMNNQKPFGPIDFGQIPNGALGEGNSLTPMPGLDGPDDNTWEEGFGNAVGAEDSYTQSAANGHADPFQIETNNPFTAPFSGIHTGSDTYDFGSGIESGTWNSHTGFTSNSGAAPSTNSSSGPSPENQQSQGSDQAGQQGFDSIIDMLDLPSMNIDWENFDATTLNTDQPKAHPQMPFPELGSKQQDIAEAFSSNDAPSHRETFFSFFPNRNPTHPGATGRSANGQDKQTELDWSLDSMPGLDFGTENKMDFAGTDALQGRQQDLGWQSNMR